MLFYFMRKNEFVKAVVAILGGFIYSAGVNLFIVPHSFYTGGLLGICQLIRTFLVDFLGISFGNIDIAGVLFLIINVPMFLAAYKYIGKRFILKTALTVVTMTLFLSLIVVPGKPLVEDALTSCIIGAIVSGIGTGIIFTMTASGGGLDILALMFSKKYKTMSFGKVNIAVNIVVYAICLFTFDISVLVYSVIYTVFYSIIVDKMHQQNISVQTLIFTKKDAEKIETAIMESLGRGVTYWSGHGGFTGEDMKILCVCLSKYEIPDLKKIVYMVDKQAFFIEQDGVKVEGNFLKKL